MLKDIGDQTDFVGSNAGSFTSRRASFCRELSEALSSLFARCAPAREVPGNNEFHDSRHVTSKMADGRWRNEPFSSTFLRPPPFPYHILPPSPLLPQTPPTYPP